MARRLSFAGGGGASKQTAGWSFDGNPGTNANNFGLVAQGTPLTNFVPMSRAGSVRAMAAYRHSPFDGTGTVELKKNNSSSATTTMTLSPGVQKTSKTFASGEIPFSALDDWRVTLDTDGSWTQQRVLVLLEVEYD